MDAQLCFLYFFVDLIPNLSLAIHSPHFFFKFSFHMWVYAEMKIHQMKTKKLPKMIIEIIQINKRIYNRWNLLLKNDYILVLNSPYTIVCKFKQTPEVWMLHYILCTTSFFYIFVFKNCDDIFFKCTSCKYLVFRLKTVFVVREWLPTNRQIIHNFFLFFFLGNPCDTSSLYYTL